MEQINLKGYKVIYRENVYKCITVRLLFGNIETKERDNGINVPEKNIHKPKWIDCFVFDFEGNILLLTDEAHMFDFMKEEVKVSDRKVTYLCDRLACGKCSNVYCKHTLDIKHAINFENIGGVYFEKESKNDNECNLKEIQDKVDYYKHEYYSECDLREERERYQLTDEEINFLIRYIQNSELIDEVKNIINKLKKQKKQINEKQA